MPADTRAWYDLGLYYRLAHRDAEATAAFRKIVALDPWNSLGLVCLGSSLLNSQDPEDRREAEAVIRKSILASPHHRYSRELLMSLLEKEKRTDEEDHEKRLLDLMIKASPRHDAPASSTGFTFTSVPGPPQR